jgi:hypothetical protein
MTSSHGVVQGYNGSRSSMGRLKSSSMPKLTGRDMRRTCWPRSSRQHLSDIPIAHLSATDDHKASRGRSAEASQQCNEAVQRMRRKFDTPVGRELYSRRMGTVETVFANIKNKGCGDSHSGPERR